METCLHNADRAIFSCVASNPNCFVLLLITLLCDWLRLGKLAPLNQSNANQNHSRLARSQFDQFYFEFPSAFKGILPFSEGMAVVLALALHCFTTLNRKMLSLFFKKKNFYVIC